MKMSDDDSKSVDSDLIDQSSDDSIEESLHQQANPSSNQSSVRSLNHPTNQSDNQTINHSISQSSNHRRKPSPLPDLIPRDHVVLDDVIGARYHLTCDVLDFDWWISDSADPTISQSLHQSSNQSNNQFIQDHIEGNRLTIEALDFKLVLSLYLNAYRVISVPLVRPKAQRKPPSNPTQQSNQSNNQITEPVSLELIETSDHSRPLTVLTLHSSNHAINQAPHRSNTQLNTYSTHQSFSQPTSQPFRLILTNYQSIDELNRFVQLIHSVWANPKSDLWLDVPDGARLQAQLRHLINQTINQSNKQADAEARAKQIEDDHRMAQAEELRLNSIPIKQSKQSNHLSISQPVSRKRASSPTPAVPLQPIIQPSKSSTRGAALTGFRNVGNSCYMNAILQALLSVPSFVDDLIDDSVVKVDQTISSSSPTDQPIDTSSHESILVRLADQSSKRSSSNRPIKLTRSALKRDSFYASLVNIVRELRNHDHGVIDVALIKQSIKLRSKQFDNDLQQDAHEFLSECLNYLDEDLGSSIQLNDQTSNLTINLPKNQTSDSSNNLSNTSPNSQSNQPSNHMSNQTITESPRQPNSPSSSHSSEGSDSLIDLTSPQTPPSPTCTSVPVATNQTNQQSTTQSASQSSTPASNQSDYQSVLRALSPVDRNFHVVVEFTLTCTNTQCNYTRKNRETFHSLSLDIPDQSINHTSASPSSSSPNRSMGASPSPSPSPTLESLVQSTEPPPLDLPPAVNQASGQTTKPKRAPRAKRNTPVGELTGMLHKFFEPRLIDYKCDHCDNNQVIVSANIVQLPRVLILHIKRFLPNLMKATYEKRADRITIAQSIDLSFACNQSTNPPLDVSEARPQLEILSGDSSPSSPSRPNNKRKNAAHSQSIDQTIDPAHEHHHADPESDPIMNKRHKPDADQSINRSINQSPLPLLSSALAHTSLASQPVPDVRLTRSHAAQQAGNQTNNHSIAFPDSFSSPSDEAELIARVTSAENEVKETPVKTRLASHNQTNHPNKQRNDNGYRLLSIVQHRGPVAYAGHYVTDVRDRDEEGAIWTRYDDQFVKQVTGEQAIRQGETEGYLLFFQHQGALQ